MNEEQSKLVSSYQQYLPTVLQEGDFIGKFLLAFEKILSGQNKTYRKGEIIKKENQNLRGLEEIIDSIHIYFNPQQTPEEFLPWLANWVALSLKNDWEKAAKIEFIQQIVELYRYRGTKTGLEKILGIYLKNSGFREEVKIFDQFKNFPNYFQVQLTLNDTDPEQYWQEAKIAKAIIDIEKPAQTFYSLKILVPTMQITKPSQLIFPFKLFESLHALLPQQQLDSDLAAIIDKIELEAIVKVNQPQAVTQDLLNKIIVRFKDDMSENHLFTPENIIEDIENNQITIKRTIYHQRIIQSIDNLSVTIKNLNTIDIVGEIIVTATLDINQSSSSYELLKQNFNIPVTNPFNVLEVCRKDEDGEIIIGETIPTILGTTSQSFNQLDPKT